MGDRRIKKLSAMTGRYDLNTRNHQERIDAFYWAALVHDIGKFRS
jgi:HD-GYP domain-containing protein (c-di-GMP phosphodiesterase class II)